MESRKGGTQRIPELDGVRGVAILMVLAWHYGFCQVKMDSPGWLHKAVRPLQMTWSGVDLFFVLSGFLITGILLEHRNAGNYYKVFYVRRACRILPIYIVVMGGLGVLTGLGLASQEGFQWLLGHGFPWWTYATFTQNFAMASRGNFGAHGTGVTWSLAVEEQSYLCMPLLVRWCEGRRLLVACVAGVAIALILRIWSGGFHAFVLLPWRMDSVLFGAIAAMAVRHSGVRAVIDSHGRRYAFLVAGLAVAPVLSTIHSGWWGAWTHFWLAAFYAGFIVLVCTQRNGWVAGCVRQRWLMVLGQISYSLYMFHQIVSGLLHAGFKRQEPSLRDAGDAVLTCSALAISVAAAWVSYTYCESYWMKWGHGFRYADGTDAKDSSQAPVLERRNGPLSDPTS